MIRCQTSIYNALYASSLAIAWMAGPPAFAEEARETGAAEMTPFAAIFVSAVANREGSIITVTAEFDIGHIDSGPFVYTVDTTGMSVSAKQ